MTHENMQSFADLADRARRMGFSSVADAIESLVRQVAERDEIIAEMKRAYNMACERPSYIVPGSNAGAPPPWK